MNISKETLLELDNCVTFRFTKNGYIECSIDDATEINIGFEKNNGKTVDNDTIINYIGKTIKTTKKEMTFDYIMNKINSDKTFVNF